MRKASTVRNTLMIALLAATPWLAQAQTANPANAPASTTKASAAAAAKGSLTEPQVRALLAEQGYTRIDDLDFEDGMWETDATSANGDRVDLRVNPANGDVKAEKLVSKFSENDIKAKLAAEGYSKVHDVDFDDGLWKAEAERADGNDVEIHLDANTGAIIHVEND